MRDAAGVWPAGCPLRKWVLTLGFSGLALGLGGPACGGTTPTDAPDAGEDAGTVDAAPELDSAAGEDAGRDAPVDAPKDSPDPPDGYCAKLSPKPKFCDDFDDGDLTDDWDVPTFINGNSDLDLDPVSYTSAPTSFAVGSRALLNNQIGHAHLRSTVLGTVSHPKLSFSAFYPVVALDKGVVAVATLDVSSTHFFTLYLRDGDMTSPGPSLEESVDGVTTRHPLTKLPPPGVWTRITIDLDFVAGTATVSFGADKALDAEPIAAVPGTEATFRVGAVYVFGPTDAFSAGYDDVVVDF